VVGPHWINGRDRPPLGKSRFPEGPIRHRLRASTWTYVRLASVTHVQAYKIENKNNARNVPCGIIFGHFGRR